MSEIKKKLPLRCPSCESALHVSRMHCGECGTEVSGNFSLPVLACLTEKDQEFILDFVRSSGSLKDMAKNMGISYPTVRNLLDDIIERINQISE